MSDGTIGYGGGIAPRVGVLAAAPASGDQDNRKRGAKFMLRKGKPDRSPTSVQSDANRVPRGGAADLNIETDGQ